jgi:hypothetical protein
MSMPFQPFQPKSLSVAVGQNNHVVSTDRFKRMIRAIVLWCTIDVLIGSGTIVWSVLTLFAGGKPIQFFDLFAHGELLIISALIAANAIGDLIRNEGISSTRSTILFCVTLLILLFGFLGFPSLGPGGEAVNIVGYGQFSLAWYFLSIITGLHCVIIKEQ